MVATLIWFYTLKNQNYYEEITLGFTASELPYINISIGCEQYSMVVDLGSRFEIDMKSDTLKHLPKSRLGTEKWKNFKGSEFIRPSYILPEIRIGSLVFTNSSVVEVFTTDREDSVIWRDQKGSKISPKTAGSLGRKLFKSLNLLFDIRKSKMVISNDLKKLKKHGYDLKTYAKVPFTLHPKGIILNIDTDIGGLNFILDTGSTCTTIHNYLHPVNKSKVFDHRNLSNFCSKKFAVGSTDFGPKRLYFLNMSKDLQEFDGLLGMDFIKEHVIYVDFSKNEIHIR